MKEREEEDLEALDAAVDRMRKLLPAGPYIETIDQERDQQYHYHDRPSSEAWLKNAPFTRHEHWSLQYQTWNYKEWGTDLIQLRVHSQFEEKPRENAKAKEETKSAIGTPQVGPKKKKISLSAYKDKKANVGSDTPSADAKQPSRDNAQINQHKHHVEDGVSREDMAKRSQADKASDNGSLKRKRVDGKPQYASIQNTSAKRTRAATPEPKSLPPSSQKSQSASHQKRKRDGDHDDELPERLSPLGAPSLPARLSPIAQLPSRLSPDLPDTNQLPGRLSPSLPDNVIAELNKRKKSRADAEAEEKSTKHDSVRSNGKMAEVKVEGGQDSNERVESAPKKIKHESEGSQPKSIEVRKVAEKVPVKHEPPAHSRKESSEDRKPERLIIRFKIPKRLRQDYRRLLQFPARPAKAMKEESFHSDEVRSSAPVRQAEARVKAEKRPSTPVESATHPSPELTKSMFATPSGRKEKDKDSRPHLTKLEEHASTSSPALPDATPLSNSSVAPRPSPVTSSTRTALSESWMAEKSRLVALGKSLKKSAQELSSSSSTAETSALTNIESLLSFMLAFHAHDMSYATRQPAVVTGLDPRATWCTLHGFWKFVHNVCGPWPALQGLVGGLGEAYCGQILAWCAVHPAGTVGVNGSSGGRTDEHAEVIASLSRIAAQKALSLRSIREAFPETWKRGLEGVGASDERDKTRPGVYEGGFDLPVGMQSGTLHAVRAAVCMLREWRCKDGKKFEPRLKLKKT